ADDACLVQVKSEAKPTATVDGVDLFVLGDDSMSTQLSKTERVLVSGLAFTNANDASGLDATAATGRADGPRFVIEPRGTAATLVTEAETARTRLVQKGLEELRAVEADVERARFFRLADIFKKCRDNALALAKRYEQSEVEGRAKVLSASVALEIGALEVDVN